MNITLKKTAACLAVLIMALSAFSSCSNNSVNQEYIKNVVSSADTSTEANKADKSNSPEIKVSKNSSATVINTANLFSDRDLLQTSDTSDAEKLTVSDDKTIDITDEGVYIISGSAKNCTIKVNADKNAKIQLVIDGAEIENDNFPTIYVVSCDKVFITTTDKGGSLAVNKEFTTDGDTNTDAVIFSKDDLVLNGTGTLTIYSAYGNGISTKDDLKITGGTYKMTTAKDSFEASDSISIYDGNFSIKTNKDGFHCENSEDDTLGQVYISNGSFEINAQSDGIQGTTYVQIDGGTFNITAQEGIEATYVQINGGNIIIEASDDGINASRKSSACDIVIEFNGGETTITMGQGDTDGVDSNGMIIVNGGTINVTAQLSSFDYESSAEFNGGTIIINGEEVDEIPQSMIGGPGGHGNFGGRPDGNFTPPDGFSKDNFTPPEGFSDSDFTPPDGFPDNFDTKSDTSEKFGERRDFEGNRGNFKGGQDGGFAEKNKSETGGFIEKT